MYNYYDENYEIESKIIENGIEIDHFYLEIDHDTPSPDFDSDFDIVVESIG